MPQYQSGLEASARKSDPVVFASGTYTPPFQPTGIVATGAGDVVGKLLEDSADRTFGVTAGTNPLRFKSITESGTTAPGLVIVRG